MGRMMQQLQSFDWLPSPCRHNNISITQMLSKHKMWDVNLMKNYHIWDLSPISRGKGKNGAAFAAPERMREINCSLRYWCGSTQGPLV